MYRALVGKQPTSPPWIWAVIAVGVVERMPSCRHAFPLEQARIGPARHLGEGFLHLHLVANPARPRIVSAGGYLQTSPGPVVTVAETVGRREQEYRFPSFVPEV